MLVIVIIVQGQLPGGKGFLGGGRILYVIPLSILAGPAITPETLYREEGGYKGLFNKCRPRKIIDKGLWGCAWGCAMYFFPHQRKS